MIGKVTVSGRPNVDVDSFDTVYTDGGVYGRNPSRIGGVWAWCYVKEDSFVTAGSGYVQPEDIKLPVVTNNMTELYAMLQAFEDLPPGWKGTVVTDSLNTLRRFRESDSQSFKGVPHELRQRVRDVRRKFPDVGFLLVAGHASQQDLRVGYKEGLPVSKWNVWCDKQCWKEKDRFRIEVLETRHGIKSAKNGDGEDAGNPGGLSGADHAGDGFVQVLTDFQK
jgi:ribonuclease HI